LAIAYFCLATALLIWPLYPWLANRIEPRLFGLPWSLAWILGVIVANFLVLALLYRLRLIDDREHDELAEASQASQASQ
jgi:TRAP-type C4-dicarboxylate transport system permease small subunit